MKHIFTLIMVLLVSVSCVEDEFGNVEGTWIYTATPSSGGVGNKFIRPPDISPDPCDNFVSITFDNNLTGVQLKGQEAENDCESEPDSYSFEYNIKEGVLTISYEDPQQAPDANYDLSGENSFIVSDNELRITSEKGLVSVLTKQ